MYHSCCPFYICDWRTVKTESVSGDVLGTLRPREGVTRRCADRRTRQQLKARSRYFGNSSDRNSWGAGTRRQQTITASHRLLNYSDLPVVSSQQVKQSYFFVVYCTTLSVTQTTWRWIGKIGNEVAMTKSSPGGTDENRDSWWRARIRTRRIPRTSRLFLLISLWGIFCAHRVYGEDSISSVPFLLTITNSQGLTSEMNLLYSFYQACP
jgi:hypothetical protein